MSTGKKGPSVTNETVDEQILINIATEAFVKELGLEDDPNLCGGHVQIRELTSGTYIMKEESQKV